MQAQLVKYTFREEVANVSTHGAALILSVGGLVALVRYAAAHGDGLHVVGAAVFGAALVLAYATSTLYHSVWLPEYKQVCRLIDHSSIYLLIAGTYTPFTLGLMRNGWGWTLFGVIWALAVAGVLFKLFSRQRYRRVTVLIYLAMGWLAVAAIKPVTEALPEGCLPWVVTGGLLYTFGVGFYLWRRLPFNHAIWHLFVMGGSFSHFVAVYWYVLPRAGAAGA